MRLRLCPPYLSFTSVLPRHRAAVDVLLNVRFAEQPSPSDHRGANLATSAYRWFLLIRRMAHTSLAVSSFCTVG